MYHVVWQTGPAYMSFYTFLCLCALLYLAPLVCIVEIAYSYLQKWGQYLHSSKGDCECVCFIRWNM